MRKYEKARRIEIELRCKCGLGCESYTRAEIPEDTDASDLLKTIGANDLMRNEQMPFSGDIKTIGGPITAGKLLAGMYTVYGPKDIECEIGDRIRRKYPQTERA